TVYQRQRWSNRTYEKTRRPLAGYSSGEGEGGLGALGEIRTPDPRIRSPMLYPAELRARLCCGRNISTAPNTRVGLTPLPRVRGRGACGCPAVQAFGKSLRIAISAASPGD